MKDIKCYPNNRDEFVGAETLMKWLHGRTSGVFSADGTAAVSAAQNKMAVTLSDGYGWITDEEKNGVVWWVDWQKTTGQLLELSIDPADSILDRIDRLIIEWTTTNYSEYPIAKILKGSNSSNPSAPVLTNNSTTRQISLARIYIAAGTLSLTNSMITDERLDDTVCGIVTDRVEVDTSMMHAQVEATLAELRQQTDETLNDTQNQASAVLSAIEEELANLEAGTGVELRKLQFTDTVVPVSAFEADDTYQDFPYRASVALEGVISTMIPDVVLGVADATSGNYAPVAECYNGGVYLYAASSPEGEMTIPTIICWKGNA